MHRIRHTIPNGIFPILTEELARVKAAKQDLETELARRELEQSELKRDLDEERHLRKQVEKNAEQVEKNADERIKSVRQDLETELARLRDSLAKRELEQAGHISILCSDGPGLSTNESESVAIVQRPLIPNGKYAIKNRAKPAANLNCVFWNSKVYTVPFRSISQSHFTRTSEFTNSNACHAVTHQKTLENGPKSANFLTNHH